MNNAGLLPIMAYAFALLIFSLSSPLILSNQFLLFQYTVFLYN